MEVWQITSWTRHCVLPWWPKWCLRKHKSRLPCRWSSDGSPLLGNRTIHGSIKEPFGKLSRSAQVRRAPLFSTTITGNLKKGRYWVYCSLWKLLLIPWGTTMGLLTPEWDYSIAPRMPEVEKHRGKTRRSEKNLWAYWSHSRSFRWGDVAPASCLVMTTFIQLQLKAKYELLPKDQPHKKKKSFPVI